MQVLCNCKKIENAQDLNKVHTYAIEGAEYLRNIGFGKKFCKVCEEVNRQMENAYKWWDAFNKNNRIRMRMLERQKRRRNN